MIHHEPQDTQCACGCQLQRICEDVIEKLDYLKDVLTRLPTQRASEIGQLLPHQWVPA
ncbi:putative Helix-turn-helix domain of transposase IS66 [compost metagenome]